MFRNIIIQMQKRLEYIKNPATIITMIVFVFWLWVGRTTLNNRIQNLEDFRSEVNIIEIQKDIQEIKVNISRIMNDLQSKK